MRVYAEDPVRFLPGPGAISRYEEPTGEGIRVDSGYAMAMSSPRTTTRCSRSFASGLRTGPSCSPALPQLWTATSIEGPKVNLPFFTRLLAEPAFVSGEYDTGLVGSMSAPRRS